MQLYHFTAKEYVFSIRSRGIVKGDVPLTPTGGFNAPWLTSNPSWDNQGWDRGSILDKRKARITVEVPDNDRNLIRWLDLAKREKIDSVWLAALHEAAGGGSSDWYVYRGTIPSSWFTRIDFRPDELQSKVVTGSEWGFGKTVQEQVQQMTIHRLDGFDNLDSRFPLGPVGMTGTLKNALEATDVTTDEMAESLYDLVKAHAAKQPPPGVEIRECMIHLGNGPRGIPIRAMTWFHPKNHTIIGLADEPVSLPLVGATA